MKSVPAQSLSLVALLTVGSATMPTLQAGEPIQFSREKPSTVRTPDDKSRVPKPSERLGRLNPSSPLDMVPSAPQESAPRDPKEDRRRKNSEREKKDWATYEKGELQEQDDEDNAFGIRDYSLEKDDGTAGSIFARKDSNGQNTGRPRLASLHNPSSSRNQPAPVRPAEDAKNDRNRSGGEEKPSPGEQHKLTPLDRASTSSGSDLLRVLNSGKSAGRSAIEGGGLTPGLNGNSARSGDDSDRRRAATDASSATRTPSDSSSPGPNWSSGFGSTRASTPNFATALSAPAAPALKSPVQRNFGGGSSASRPDGNFGRAPNAFSLTPPALSDPYYNSRSASPGFGSPSSPAQPPRSQASGQSTYDKFRIR